MIREIFFKIRFGVGVLTLMVFWGLMAQAAAQNLPREEIGNHLERNLKKEKTLLFLPRGDLYRFYFADPHHPGFGAMLISVTDNDIGDTGSYRVGLKAGGRFGIIRVHPEDRPDLGWQLSFEAGMDGLFDLDNSQDNLGWDGNFGWYLTTAQEEGWSFKLALLHTSSHLGDELIERTGRQRINYTRREVALGVSKALNPHWRTYGELGLGYHPGNEDLQEMGRLQGGLEFEGPTGVFGGFFGWFGGIDVSAMEERGWKLDVALQGGLSVPTGQRSNRIGIEVYRGRPTIAEFFQKTETWVALAVWIDI